MKNFFFVQAAPKALLINNRPALAGYHTILATVLTTFFLYAIFTSQTSAKTFSAKTFPDVGDNEIYKTGIEFLASNGIINGYPDGTYKPLNPINRAEMLKIIAEGSAKLNNLSSGEFDAYSSQNCFSDVKANQWFTKYVCYAKDKGWVEGYENGKYFRPVQNVTFVESLKITYKGMNVSYNVNATPWYKDLVEKS
ncbi:MAG: S-layer homology domain-containing protein, partial [Patescibacteria group bacterium]